jgi:hypothetical protein
VFHAIVENQIAEGLVSAIRAMARPANEGLLHHEAIDAIVSVCAEHFFEAMKSNGRDDTTPPSNVSPQSRGDRSTVLRNAAANRVARGF